MSEGQFWGEFFVGLPDQTKIHYHPTRSPFAEIAPACGSYTVDSHTESTITITHTDPTKSGPYSLGLSIDLIDELIPHLTKMKEVTGWSNDDTKKFAKAMVDIVNIVNDDSVGENGEEPAAKALSMGEEPVKISVFKRVTRGIRRRYYNARAAWRSVK